MVLFRRLKPGTTVIREYRGVRHIVTIAEGGFVWENMRFPSLSVIMSHHGRSMERPQVLWSPWPKERRSRSEGLLLPEKPKTLRCAVYTRKSTEHNLDLEFNSLDAQRESCEAYIKSQMHEGWQLIPGSYDDGGISGGSLERPDLQRLISDIKAGRVDNVVVYKVDRLTRSLTDFAKLVELFDSHKVSFVSVTQAFNTTNSMGRLTLNVLLSFAQFELREVIAGEVSGQGCGL